MLKLILLRMDTRGLEESSRGLPGLLPLVAAGRTEGTEGRGSQYRVNPGAMMESGSSSPYPIAHTYRYGSRDPGFS